MKVIVCLLGLFTFYSSAVWANCKGYSCTGVQVEAMRKGKADFLVETTGNESLLECGDFYGQLSLKSNEDYDKVASLLAVANEHGLMVDIELHRDIKPCAISHIVVSSSK